MFLKVKLLQISVDVALFISSVSNDHARTARLNALLSVPLHWATGIFHNSFEHHLG